MGFNYRGRKLSTVVPSAGPQWIAHEEDKVTVDHVINII